jgi:hypothetical protein
MQCLSCRADNKMLLMDVLRDQSMKEPAIEHQIYMCSVCRHTTRRVGFKRIKMTIAHLPAIPTPIEKLWKERGAVPRTWANAVEKLRKKQIELKERTAAEKIVGRTKAVETVRGGFCGRASIAGFLRLAEPARAAEAVSPSDR